MGDYIPDERLYAAITQQALAGFDRGAGLAEIMEAVWTDTPGFHMHCPEHHYLTAAALLSVYRRLSGGSRERLAEDLAAALERARNVLGGFCGFYGCCGAAVGAGIFLSVFTDTNPCSRDNWQETTGITACCLQRISDAGGPRCCKRACYTVAVAAAGFMAQHYGLRADIPAAIRCSRYEQNEECIGGRCPYYPEA